MVKKLNVRVYGILSQNNSVLVSDEYIKGNKITKFPGGGLEFGEGTKDCLVREFKEELDLEIEVLDHLYTTDFFVSSSFHTNSQVISIYYFVKAKSKLNFKISLTEHNYDKKEGAQSLRWIDFNQLKDSDLTLIIDKRVGELLIKKFCK
ncbi:MAG: NUDIX domain-containing protein [Bacteroidota bacterium]|nr:NUDIX domain-containing protein [Bacteroidota bacterium]MDP3145746.1 NUDIX domain-containing protein [Bacteroidota bacterium]MDP3556845.1 NUDIX domain-containing protein [Bacteroidota bacterium]